MKNARRKLEIPMPAAMLCKTQRDKYRETCRTVEKHKTKIRLYCSSRRIYEETHGSLHKDHEDHIAGKGMNSLSHHNLVHEFIDMPQAMQIPDAQAAVDKERENPRKY